MRKPPTTARVKLLANYAGAVLELRSYSGDAWRPACTAPCDRLVMVDGMDARVSAPGMATSNVFRIDPGGGTAWLRVSGGSATTRTLGTVGLLVGIPITLVGMGLFGYGAVEDHDTLRGAGIVTLAVGATATLASLPLVLMGSTTVRDGRGHFVARSTRWQGGL